MADQVSKRFPYPYPIEPAHPGLITLHHDLMALLKHIRTRYQDAIDQAFDRVSRQIGFVVATTVPVTLEVAESGKVRSLAVGAKHLENTLFDKEIIGSLQKLIQDPTPEPARPGVYKLYVIWFEALRLKLRTDWVGRGGEEVMTPVIPLPPPRGIEPRHWVEPAHWFDPGSFIQVEEAMLIHALDEVYPELRLVERIDFYRRGMGRFDPHPDPWRANPGAVLGPFPEPWKGQLVKEINEVLRLYGVVEAIPVPLS
jgi:hypothetical protein